MAFVLVATLSMASANPARAEDQPGVVRDQWQGWKATSVYDSWNYDQYDPCINVGPDSVEVNNQNINSGELGYADQIPPGILSPLTCVRVSSLTITNTTSETIELHWLGFYPSGADASYLYGWSVDWPGDTTLEPEGSVDVILEFGIPGDVEGQGPYTIGFSFGWTVTAASDVVEPPTPPTPGTGPASLSIIKYEKPQTPTGLPHDGQQLTDQALAEAGLTSENAIPGVEFCYQQVTSDGTNPIDLTTNEGWLAAANLAQNLPLTDQVVFNPPAITDNNSDTYCQTSDATGQVDFNGLAYGLYYITERTVPFGVAAALPFLVTLPMTNADGTARSDHVYAYPKDDIAAVTKQITSPNTGKPGEKVGDLIEYTVTAKVPQLSATDSFTNYVFTDAFDTLLDFADAIGDPAPVVKIGGTTLTVVDDYLVDATAAHKLTISLSSAGLAALTTAAQSDNPTTITFVFNARANNQGADISNGGLDKGTKVGYAVNGKDIPVVESSETSVKYGGMSIWKYGYDKTDATSATITEIETALMENADGTQLGAAALAGAQFRLFLSEADAVAYAANPAAVTPVQFHTAPKPTDGSAYVATVANIDYAGSVDIVETDSQGHAMFGGLAYGEYWALEVTAPPGYSLLTAPITFEIVEPLDGTYFGSANGSIDTDDDMLVANVPANAGFPIPLTGGPGILTYLLIAITIAGLTVLVIRNQRQPSAVELDPRRLSLSKPRHTPGG